MIVTCLCCGISKEFKDPQQAFDEGWDAPPQFTLEFCNLCPASLYVLGTSHQAAHDLWARTWRPEEFSPQKCGTEEEVR